VLAGEGAANAGEFGRGVVGERSVGLDLAAQGAKEVAEVVLEERGREGFDRRPVVLELGGRCEDEAAPGVDALCMCEKREELGGFECGALDAGLVEQVRGIEQAAEVEGAADGDQTPHLGSAPLPAADPFRVGARFEGQNLGATELGARAGGQALAQTLPLERCSSAFG